MKLFIKLIALVFFSLTFIQAKASIQQEKPSFSSILETHGYEGGKAFTQTFPDPSRNPKNTAEQVRFKNQTARGFGDLGTLKIFENIAKRYTEAQIHLILRTIKLRQLFKKANQGHTEEIELAEIYLLDLRSEFRKQNLEQAFYRIDKLLEPTLKLPSHLSHLTKEARLIRAKIVEEIGGVFLPYPTKETAEQMLFTIKSTPIRGRFNFKTLQDFEGIVERYTKDQVHLILRTMKLRQLFKKANQGHIEEIKLAEIYLLDWDRGIREQNLKKAFYSIKKLFKKEIPNYLAKEAKLINEKITEELAQINKSNCNLNFK